MNHINRIYWQIDKIGLITNHLDAQTHSHWMLQLFLSIDKDIHINVAGKEITCQCIIIDKNIPHSFSANQEVYFSAIIEPTSSYAKKLTTKMNNDGYYICNHQNITSLQKQALILLESSSVENYLKFIEDLNSYLGIIEASQKYDERIVELLELLNQCSCDDHTIALFANKIALSPSRLSHLFKDEVGVPLKSYILLHQIKQACISILKDQNITKAAMASGFDSPSHFANAVKRMTGMSASVALKDSEFLQVSKY